MATATATTKTEITYTIVLSEDEANTLVDILARIGGLYETTRRRYADSIFQALENSGAYGTENEDVHDEYNTISFV